MVNFLPLNNTLNPSKISKYAGNISFAYNHDCVINLQDQPCRNALLKGMDIHIKLYYMHQMKEAK